MRSKSALNGSAPSPVAVLDRENGAAEDTRNATGVVQPPNTSADCHTYLTTVEAASYLRLRPRTLQLWRMQGKGPDYRKHGKLRVYTVADLDRWADAQRVAVHAEK
ncbi:helix-turn-helix domain-containing protein [Longimicrobium sp.]|uniref:helix-turn-helix domain-containing protein n=1 Tax=Longimicrobium sp. TaxID=2029185 RepID=UPI0039C904F2